MEKRFGLKDLVLFLLLGVLLLVVLLAMKQYDRQWEVLRHIEKQGQEQIQELSALRRLIASGIIVRGAGTSTSAPSTQAVGQEIDPFYRVKEVQQRPDYAQGDWLVDNFPANIAKLTPLI